MVPCLKNISITLLTVSILSAGMPVVVAEAAPQQKSATKGRRGAAPKSSNAKKGGAKTHETSADVKKRQEATQKEIRQTEQQIKENDRSVKMGLSELGKLEGDISASKNKIAATTKRISSLTGQISTLQGNITENEAQLKRLRDEYLKAVKKMRIARKNRSGLAFVFASENFNQALRRMRYLRQFSDWKDRQSAAIDSKTAELRTQQEGLAKARKEHDVALRQQRSEQQILQQQYSRQDALVAGLKANGQALRSHLAKKQSEANDLRNRISALIAEEQRRAEEERARQEAARRAEEERKAREEAARREAEAARQAEEANRQAQLLAEEKRKESVAETAEDMAEPVKATSKTVKKEKRKEQKEDKKETGERRRKKKEANAGKGKSDNVAPAGSVPKNYADARKRTQRGEASNSSATPASASSASNFAGMKGSLPHPVSGAFRVVSRFGRQSLPELPDVVYDNPGIDAETGAGASALAVYGGKVSGVYMIPGYNTVVIVNHGSYYTVYGNIASSSVKVGDQVRAGQALGLLAADEDDRSHSSIHFEVWRNREKLNPLDWLK